LTAYGRTEKKKEEKKEMGWVFGWNEMLYRVWLSGMELFSS